MHATRSNMSVRFDDGPYQLIGPTIAHAPARSKRR